MVLAPLVLLFAAVPALDVDRVETEIVARIGEDLSRAVLSVKSTYTPAVSVHRISIILAADRHRRPPKGMRPSEEREVYRGGTSFGGFENVRVEIGGAPCSEPEQQTLDDGAAVLWCKAEIAAGRPVSLQIAAELAIPEKYGEIGRHHRQVTLGAGWYPYVARPDAPPAFGPHKVAVDLPTEYGAVIGRRYFSPSGDLGGPSVRRLEATIDPAANVPLVVLPPSAGRAKIAGGHALYVSPLGRLVHDKDARGEREEQVVEALEDGLRYWEEQGLRLPDPGHPLVVVDTPLRHVLALAADGAVLVSDHAFRMLPVRRFYRFHRFPLLREVFAELLLLQAKKRDALTFVAADAAAAFLVDRYVKERFERRENAFDVLSWLSFIPAIDALLYAPDLPFEGAYFRRTKEDDPLRPNLVDDPNRVPRGKIVFEKLVDRAKRDSVERVFGAVLRGAPLEPALARELGGEGEARAFLAQWLRPYPKVQYRLAGSSSKRWSCGGSPCFLASVEIARMGEAVKEPIEVFLRDEKGFERTAWSEVTDAAVRTVTATLSAPLAYVEIDPEERIYETPTEEVPSPRLDNRSSSSWKFLINNWNISLAATAGTVDTALDVGLLRVYDVHWAYAVRASYDPAAIALEGRASYGLGDLVTPAELDQRIGFIFAGEYLRPSFGGTRESAFGVSTALYYAFDTRQTVWMPEGGRGVRATLEYNHTFGQLTEIAGGVQRALSQDSMALTLRAFQAWRLGAAHTISIRGAAGSYLFGEPRAQLLYALGGRRNVRGYNIDARLGKAEGIASLEWIHTVLPELNENFLYFVWASGLDGTLFADLAVVADDLKSIRSAPPSADVGYGLRIFIDYFGVRTGIMAVDVAFPLYDVYGKAGLGPPAVYIDFTQSF